MVTQWPALYTWKRRLQILQTSLPSTEKFTTVMAFECDICHKSFSTGGNRSRHIRQVHQGERHTCHQCGKSYGQQVKLQEHLKKCQTQWSCSTCGQDFNSLLPFNRHKVTQHPELVPQSRATKKRKGKLKNNVLNPNEFVFSSMNCVLNL